ncbi:uncharacterized protein HMPREF1541_07265 [Cyphellophora europaea CBS 101466]|uniref:CAP-Gly domain-containing protein n=1 Tax=Cyphellophora europaea (strain CBS 101466) TaxID=1220924 RepID=W2RMC9_CYPE1|nr:uncharacterized protein HMPREF1541_07265 [Cyphellophora europaea CBS 101466]ETN37642.1 hypothetical protein HMPREF1541_07265 [Cyphellophora europaea CBS 101466]
MDVKIGQTVESKDGKQGIVRYAGTLEIASGSWLGLELPDRSGKNDGSVQGKRYFSCQQGYGIFIRKESVVRIVKQAPSVPRTNGTAVASSGAAKARQSTIGAGADAARKRQSMMSTGSSTAGSRLSLRSPTKSPTKGMSSASSTASTPRTGTPATTARTSDSSTKSRLSTTGRTSMAPPPAPKKTTPATRQSMSGGIGRSAASPASKSSAGSRASLGTSRLSLQPRVAPEATSHPSRTRAADEDSHPRSPTIDEDEEDEGPGAESIDHVLQQQSPQEDVPQPPPEPAPSETTRSRTTSISRANHTAENRAADKKEVEQLKAKLRTIEKKAAEDREKLQKFDTLQNDKDRYETIIQTLQKKLKTNQQTMSDLRALKDEAEQKAAQVPPPTSGEIESELELANLDREMAEERAELAQAELDMLKSKHEELELELEILREENRELGSSMSQEELSSAGWLQKEREVERLRQALGLLRDHSKETESELHSQIRELQDTVDETEKMAALYEQTAQKLAQLDSTNKHLMEQLEDAETNDEVVVAMEAQREQAAATIEQLKKQIQEFEEHIQVTDELERFHIDEERQLHYDLDESEAQLNEKHRQVLEQEKAIEDLEFTLSKFREVVSGLQGDIDELRRSRDLNETQANEMNVKSRAMMDLNLQLQNSAAKTQLKTIDYEMRDMQAEQARSHLEIVQLFVPESFDQDRNPVLALLALKRIKSKAMLVKSILGDRMRDRPHLAQDDPFSVFEVMEKMDRIAACCARFIDFINTCSTEEFTRLSGAVYELEPVERSVSVWVDALRRDELGTESAETLQRMIGILLDMSEKLISESTESKATELVSQCSLAERYADITALQLTALLKAVQLRLGEPKEDDEEALAFDKKLDAAATKARTVKYLASKVTAALADLRANAMCLGETAWVFFEDTERAAEQLSAFVREVGKVVIDELNKFDSEQSPSYASMADLMSAKATTLAVQPEAKASSPDDIFNMLTQSLSSLQSRIDDLSHKSADVSSAVEFESSLIAPWAARAKALKAQKLLSQDTAEELQRVKARSEGQARDLTEKSKEAEELRIRVEVLESRQKESKAKDSEVRALKDDADRIAREKASLIDELERTKSDMEETLAKREKEREELQALKSAALANGGAAATQVVSSLGEAGESGGALRAEIDALQVEILSLQSAVRYLRAENSALKVPVGEVALRAERNSWLSADHLKSKRALNQAQERKERVRKEGKDVLEGLIELAAGAKGVKLKIRERGTIGGDGWQRMESTTRWHVARQREMVEQWKGEVDEVIRRSKLDVRSTTNAGGARIRGKYALPDLPEGKGGLVDGNRRVGIVGEDGVDGRA